MNSSDRRQYQRHKTEILASVHTRDETILATITDIGRGGFGMILEKAIPQQSQVVIELEFSGEYAIKGTVTWSSQILQGQNTVYCVGIQAESIIWTDLKAVAFPEWDDLVRKIISEAASR